MAQLAQTADQIQGRLLQFARESEERLAAEEAAILKDISLVSSTSIRQSLRTALFDQGMLAYRKSK